MNLLSSRALSAEMPDASVATWRAVPPAASSTLPYETPLSDTLRLTNFSSSTWRAALRRSSLTDLSVMSDSVSSTLVSVPLKS